MNQESRFLNNFKSKNILCKTFLVLKTSQVKMKFWTKHIPEQKNYQN